MFEGQQVVAGLNGEAGGMQEEVVGFVPTPSDLDYPAKLLEPRQGEFGSDEQDVLLEASDGIQGPLGTDNATVSPIALPPQGIPICACRDGAEKVCQVAQTTEECRLILAHWHLEQRDWVLGRARRGEGGTRAAPCPGFYLKGCVGRGGYSKRALPWRTRCGIRLYSRRCCAYRSCTAAWTSGSLRGSLRTPSPPAPPLSRPVSLPPPHTPASVPVVLPPLAVPPLRRRHARNTVELSSTCTLPLWLPTLVCFFSICFSG